MKKQQDLNGELSSEMSTDGSDSNHDSGDNCRSSDSDAEIFVVMVQKPHFRLEIKRKEWIKNFAQINDLVQKVVAPNKVKLRIERPMNFFGRKKTKSKPKKKETSHHVQKVNESNSSYSANETEIKKECESEILSTGEVPIWLQVSKSYLSNLNNNGGSIQFLNAKDQTVSSDINVGMPPNENVQNTINSLTTYGDENNGDLDYLVESMDISQEIKSEPASITSDDEELIRALTDSPDPRLLESVEKPQSAKFGPDHVVRNEEGTIETPLLDPKLKIKVEIDAEEPGPEIVTLSESDENDEELGVNCKIEIKSEEIEDHGLEIPVFSSCPQFSIASGSNDNTENSESMMHKIEIIHEVDQIQTTKRVNCSEEDPPGSPVRSQSEETSDENTTSRTKTIGKQKRGFKRKLTECYEISKEIDKAIDEFLDGNHRNENNRTTFGSKDSRSTDNQHQDKKDNQNTNSRDKALAHNENLSHNSKSNVVEYSPHEKGLLDQGKTKSENNIKRVKVGLGNQDRDIDAQALRKYKTPVSEKGDVSEMHSINREMFGVHNIATSDGQIEYRKTLIVDRENSFNDRKVPPVNRSHISDTKAEGHESLITVEGTLLEAVITAGAKSSSESIPFKSDSSFNTERNPMVSKSKTENSNTSATDSAEKSEVNKTFLVKKHSFSEVNADIRKSFEDVHPRKKMDLETILPCDLSTSKGKIENGGISTAENTEYFNPGKVFLPEGKHVSNVTAQEPLDFTNETLSKTGTSAERFGNTHAEMPSFHDNSEERRMVSVDDNIPKKSEIQATRIEHSGTSFGCHDRFSDQDDIHPGQPPLDEQGQSEKIWQTVRTTSEGSRRQHPSQALRCFPATTNSVGESNCRTFQPFLMRILHWNPVWLQKKVCFYMTQKIARKRQLAPMRPIYETYGGDRGYYSDAEDLLALNIWYSMMSQIETNTLPENGYECRRKFKFSIVSHYWTPNEEDRHKNVKSTTFILDVVVGIGEKWRSTHPSVDDLVWFDYFPEQQKKKGKGTIRSQVFGYVMDVRSNLISEDMRFNHNLMRTVKEPYRLLTYEVITKAIRESDIKTDTIFEMQMLSNFKMNVRSIEALQNLPDSPLLNFILNPKSQDYQLQPAKNLENFSLITKDNLDDKQKEVVARITDTVLEGKPKICLIHGPPGTGKTKVIVNLVTQLIHANRNDQKKQLFRILVCAQSNSAVDEIVMRMLQLRQQFNSGERLKMVRIGRSDSMHEDVKKVSLSELAIRDAQRFIETLKIPEKAEKIRKFHEDLITELERDRSETTSINMEKRILRRIIGHRAHYDVSTKIDKNETPDEKENDALEKATANEILERAEVIACTLVSCRANYMGSIFDGETNAITVCIVDDATQSSEAETLLPLLLGVKILVLVGASHQQPPSLGAKTELAGLNQSLFARLQLAFNSQASNPVVQLDSQYRMTSAVAHWPEKHFYSGPLRNNTNLPSPHFHSYKVINLDSIQSKNFQPPKLNQSEGFFVMRILQTMMTRIDPRKLSAPLQIGVLTPYKCQKMWIEDKIKRGPHWMTSDLNKKLFKIDVNTIDTFQGQERDVIIMSCVGTSDIGVLADQQRLCLALTRAKHSMIICGKFEKFETHTLWKDLLSDAKSRQVYVNLKCDVTVNELKGHILR